MPLNIHWKLPLKSTLISEVLISGMQYLALSIIIIIITIITIITTIITIIINYEYSYYFHYSY